MTYSTLVVVALAVIFVVGIIAIMLGMPDNDNTS
jgi:hypothetical protein